MHPAQGTRIKRPEDAERVIGEPGGAGGGATESVDAASGESLRNHPCHRYTPLATAASASCINYGSKARAPAASTKPAPVAFACQHT